jgi:hypothetical protein
VHVFDEEFVDDAAFAGPAVVVSHVGSCPEDPEADLARSVSSEDRAILDEHDLDALSRGGDGAAGA